MFLAIDVGNSQTTFGLMDSEGNSAAIWRCQSNPKETSDELELRLRGYLQMGGFGPRDVERAAVASVVPALERGWRRVVERLFERTCVISSTMPASVEVAIANPAGLGTDRLANAVAAVERYGAPVLVVDFGTATNIDIVDAERRFVGGVISPGLMLSADALFSRAALLANVAIKCPPRVAAQTTEEAVQAGLVVGAAAEAEGLVSRIQEELGIEGCPVVATGGLARTVGEAARCFSAVDPDLTLRGIRLLALGA